MRILRGSRPCSPASSADFFAKEAKCSRHPPFLLCARSGRLPSVPFAVQTATWTSRAEDVRKRPRSQGQETAVSGAKDRGLLTGRRREGQEGPLFGPRRAHLRMSRPPRIRPVAPRRFGGYWAGCGGIRVHAPAVNRKCTSKKWGWLLVCQILCTPFLLGRDGFRLLPGFGGAAAVRPRGVWRRIVQYARECTCRFPRESCVKPSLTQ